MDGRGGLAAASTMVTRGSASSGERPGCDHHPCVQHLRATDDAVVDLGLPTQLGSKGDVDQGVLPVEPWKGPEHLLADGPSVLGRRPGKPVGSQKSSEGQGV